MRTVARPDKSDALFLPGETRDGRLEIRLAGTGWQVHIRSACTHIVFRTERQLMRDAHEQ
ncbi:conserved hypothetical protein [Ricinus communis]|uniref:Uncharacterized protein n=1 Tax=Ricinus communis TaxID=3988 RepID=B9TEJ1_RICCO|nr:conserved hypothetical protein [Ricinus communis]